MSRQCEPTTHPREEAYTTLNIQPAGLPYDNYTLRLKIDTGASGNTLPLRTLRSMAEKQTLETY